VTVTDLAQFSTVDLLRAIAERLALIETDTLERTCLLPRPMADISVYERLQDLVTAARDLPGDARLSAAIAALDAVLPVDDAEVAPGGGIVELGQRHALLARRHVELQHLYQVRMDVTRDALAKRGNDQLPSSS
jgi:hypothetical protein